MLRGGRRPLTLSIHFSETVLASDTLGVLTVLGFGFLAPFPWLECHVFPSSFRNCVLGPLAASGNVDNFSFVSSGHAATKCCDLHGRQPF